MQWPYPNKKSLDVEKLLTELRDLGIEPYPAAEFITTAYSSNSKQL
jgi:hypothetical protein